MTGWDVAVVGGGLAGAAAACRLAEAGRRVVLLERTPGPHHKVCGEFVSGEAELSLQELGLGGALRRLGGVPVERVRLAAGRITATVALPFPATGLSRRRLDGWLLRAAARRGVAVCAGQPVRGMGRDGAGVRLLTSDEPVRADAVLLATGKHDLRGAPRQGRPSTLIGLKLHLRLAPEAARALAGAVELTLFEGGYAGLQAVEGGVANLCLVVEKDRFAALERDWCRLVAAVPYLERRLDGASACWSDPLAVYRIPYGYLHRADEAAAGPVYRLGDQLAVIPSFTGDGMAMALRSATQAAAAVLAGLPPAVYHRRMVKAFTPQVRLAGAVAGLGAIAALQAPLVAACRALPNLLTTMAARTRSP